MRATRPVASCFTYTLGKSMYIPLTSRCNSVTLPETRGPNFFLPPDVVTALCRVRDEEAQTEQWKHWCMYLDTCDTPQKLPKAQESVAKLVDDSEEDDGLTPTIDTLLEQAQKQLGSKKFESVVFAGEGEPTLRLGSLIGLARKIGETATSPTLRLTTNGLIPQGTSLTENLKSSGISSVSVALMTHDPQQYEELMMPKLLEEDNNGGHERVCQFIREALKIGLHVETTGVERPDVDRDKTEELARSLGVVEPFRWRTYFP